MDGGLQKQRRMLQLQQNAGSVSDESEEPENEDVLVSEGEELEEVGESAFGKLMAALWSSQSAVSSKAVIWGGCCARQILEAEGFSGSRGKSAGSPCSFLPKVSLRAQFYRASSKMVSKGKLWVRLKN